ncbi:uncharacterized protein L201_001452 [Kwoniella dendrophila CBS 6074]|uniref:Zn(2)-C6 fungal-type domain-containing protein n=1 Tax=Kwoniella dendrophila CBS 6074 TaxID=1295534 RepID=A0AAX4JMD6_9TREE
MSTSTSSSDRACLRCISKKRKCDHERPNCGSCVKAGHTCEYPSKRQKRGPTAGSSKASENRIQQLENALYYVMGMEEVVSMLRNRLQSEILQNPLPVAPTAYIERAKLLDMWNEKPLNTHQDLLEFRAHLQSLVEKSENNEIIGERPAAGKDIVVQVHIDPLKDSAFQVEANIQAVPSDILLNTHSDSTIIQNFGETSHPNNLDFLATNAISQMPIYPAAGVDQNIHIDNYDQIGFSPDDSGHNMPYNHLLESDFGQSRGHLQSQPQSFTSPGDLPSTPSMMQISPSTSGPPTQNVNPPIPVDPSDLFW